MPWGTFGLQFQYLKNQEVSYKNSDLQFFFNSLKIQQHWAYCLLWQGHKLSGPQLVSSFICVIYLAPVDLSVYNPWCRFLLASPTKHVLSWPLPRVLGLTLLLETIGFCILNMSCSQFFFSLLTNCWHDFIYKLLNVQLNTLH